MSRRPIRGPQGCPGRRRCEHMRLKLLTLRGDDTCARCAAAIPARSKAWWGHEASSVVCVICEPLRLDDPLPPPEIERAKAVPATSPHHRASDVHDRETRPRSGPGVLGRVMKLLADEPSTTTAHPNEAARERRLGRLLDIELVDAATLHDRTVPTTNCHLDHLVVASSGIWLIDAKRSAGEVECRSTGAPGGDDRRLYVNGRNQTQLVHTMGWQVAAMRSRLERIGLSEVPLHPVVCFTSSRWARVTAPFEVHRVLVTWPSALLDAIAAPGPIDARLIDLVTHDLSRTLEAHDRSATLGIR